MTIIQIIQILAALTGASKDLYDLVAELRGAGHPDDQPIPPAFLARLRTAMSPVAGNWTPPGFDWDSEHEGG